MASSDSRLVDPTWLAAAAALPQQFASLAPALEQALGAVQQNFGTAKTAAEDAAASLETSGTAATEGLSRCGNALLDATRANTNAAFELTAKLLETRTVAEATELWTAHAARQFQAFQDLTRELGRMAQDTLQDTTAPLTEAAANAAKGASDATSGAVDDTLAEAIRSVDAARKGS